MLIAYPLDFGGCDRRFVGTEARAGVGCQRCNVGIGEDPAEAGHLAVIHPPAQFDSTGDSVEEDTH